MHPPQTSGETVDETRDRTTDESAQYRPVYGTPHSQSTENRSEKTDIIKFYVSFVVVESNVAMIVATIRHYIHHVSSYYTIYVGPIAYHATKLPKLFLLLLVLRLALLRLWLAHHLAFLLIVASAPSLPLPSSATTAAATLLGGAL